MCRGRGACVRPSWLTCQSRRLAACRQGDGSPAHRHCHSPHPGAHLRLSGLHMSIQKRKLRRDPGMMVSPAHPSLSPARPLMKAAAAGQPGSLGDSREGKSWWKRRSQLDLQCNYSRAARQHKLGPCAAVFLFVQKLIFISEEKPFNF